MADKEYKFRSPNGSPLTLRHFTLIIDGVLTLASNRSEVFHPNDADRSIFAVFCDECFGSRIVDYLKAAGYRHLETERAG